MPDSATDSLHVLLDLIDEAFDHTAWHGPTLRGSLRGVTAEAASWRPAPRRHNVWEVAVHAAYWKYAVRRILTDEKRGSFVLKGSNWFLRPQVPSAGRLDRAWAGDIQLLVAEHVRLREAIARMTTRDIGRPPRGKTRPAAFYIRGIAAHDLYHAGQIQLLKRLRTTRAVPPSPLR